MKLLLNFAQILYGGNGNCCDIGSTNSLGRILNSILVNVKSTKFMSY